MKLSGLWAIGIGTIVSAGLFAGEQAYAGENDHPAKCTLETLYGQYLVAAHGTLFGTPANPGPFGVTQPSTSEAAGFSIYYGDGTGEDYVTFTVNGVNENVTSPTPFTYTLNSNCTGTRTVLPYGPSFNIFAAFDGDGLSAIATTPGFAESDYERRTGSQ